MANRKLQILYKKIYKNGNIDTIYFKNRAKDVIVDENGNVTLDTVLDRLNQVANGATKTAKSDSNGYIKINDTDTLVYEHPRTGVVPGRYNEVVVDDKGHVVSAKYSNNWGGTVNGGEVSLSVISGVQWQVINPNSIHSIADGWNLKSVIGTLVGIIKGLKPVAFHDKVYSGDIEPGIVLKINSAVQRADVYHDILPNDVTNRTPYRIASMNAVAKANKAANDSWTAINGNIGRLNRIDAEMNTLRNDLYRRGTLWRFNVIDYQIPLTSTLREIWTENNFEAGTYIVSCRITCINVNYNCFYNFDLCKNDAQNRIAADGDMTSLYQICTKTIRTLTTFIGLAQGDRIFLNANSSNNDKDPNARGIIVENVWYQIVRMW